jgi:uncharacterized protein
VSIDELEALLLVQDSDITLDQLRHRREAMPERAELTARTAELRRTEAERAAVGERHRAVLAEEKRIDDEAQTVGERADEVNKKLYSGSVSSPRELQAMQADIDMLRKQRSDLEDQELEVMEARELLDAQIAALDADSGLVRADIERLQSAIAAAEAEIDEELTKEDTARAQQAAAVPDALVADYERRRAQNKGAGAARLVGTSCTACHLSIPSTEAENIRKGAGAVVAYCDNCGAILVP